MSINQLAGTVSEINYENYQKKQEEYTDDLLETFKKSNLANAVNDVKGAFDFMAMSAHVPYLNKMFDLKVKHLRKALKKPKIQRKMVIQKNLQSKVKDNLNQMLRCLIFPIYQKQIEQLYLKEKNQLPLLPKIQLWTKMEMSPILMILNQLEIYQQAHLRLFQIPHQN